MSLSLGISSLLIGTISDARVLQEQTRAWYAAESGLEKALFAVAQNGPGYEIEKRETLDKYDTKFEYRVRAAAKEIPLKDASQIISASDKYADLHLNESVTIPLFKGSNIADTVKKFRVDYYLAPDLKLRGGIVDEDLDILRWKIFGIADDGAMEVINEFLPMMNGKTDADHPSCIGTDSQCWNAAKFYERGKGGFNIVEHHPITTFLNQHRQNFLVLTNIVNIDMINAGTISLDDKKKIANIRYHVIEGNGKPRLTLPNIKVSSDGYSGTTKQSLDLEIKRETFLPVFNYALYRTKVGK